MERIQPSSSDRLSSLPDPLLCHIFSFLPTKPSVATSILAKRWRYLWTDMIHFDFDFEYHKANSISFPDIVNNVLLHTMRRISTFRLSYDPEIYSEDQLHFSNEQLHTWMETAISRNVQALDLRLHHLLKLPHHIFTCGTLVDLRLEGCGDIPSNVRLVNLKKLHLHLVKYEADEMFSCLISGCPVLEELNVYRIIDRKDVCCNISSSTIKRLVLSFQPCAWLDVCDHKLEINTPALEEFFLEDHVSGYISAGSVMNSLVDADIWLNNDEVKDYDVYSGSVFEFLEKLCLVKSLVFVSGYPKFSDSAFAATTLVFPNLTKLELGADWRLLMKFLESADNLEILIIGDVDEELKCFLEPEEVPRCLSSRLRQVTMNSSSCSENEFKMVSYILRNAKVLKTMDIYAQYLGDDLAGKLDAHHRISLMERGSDSCKLAVF